MSTKLNELLLVLGNASLEGDPATEVACVAHDSRTVEAGGLFVAIPGEKSDGHDYIDDAIRSGACAVMAQRPRPREHESVPWITVPDTRAVLGLVTAAVFGLPTRKLTLVGITGTNGKTTLTFLLEAILTAAGARPGVVGTISYRWTGVDRPAHHTTPEASELQQIFSDMVESGVTHAIMEVSSHGLDLGRIEGCEFDLGVFTNLTQDHLDHHGSLENYFLAKRTLFSRLLPASGKPNPAAVINLDDPYGRRLAAEIETIPVIGFGTSEDCSVRPREVSVTAGGIEASIRTVQGDIPVRSSLTGSFNLLNILAAVAVSDRLGIAPQAVQEGIESVRVVPGRLERVDSERGTIFVDYAHTPNALKNVLDALKNIRTARIITIMGCGGDRDRTKRPLMGMEAAAGSDFVIVTSDNPRTEEPLSIIRQVEEGVKNHGFAIFPVQLNGQPLPPRSYRVIPDRREAISWAIRRMGPQDILLVAGKGHETYQEIDGVRYPFDDREVVREESDKCRVAAGGDQR